MSSGQVSSLTAPERRATLDIRTAGYRVRGCETRPAGVLRVSHPAPSPFSASSPSNTSAGRRSRHLKWLPVWLFSAALLLALAQTSAPDDIVLRPGQSATVAGGWSIVSETTAAGGTAVRHANAGAAKLTSPLASPTHYFDVTFEAAGGVPYRLWLRGRAQSDSWANDSVFVQFDRTEAPAGTAAYRIGSTSALEVNLEECSGCGLQGWGWQDTGWGRGVLGPEVVFAASGTQRMRVQTREDGFTIDQIVLSPQRYLTTAPGAAKNDTTILPVSPGSTATVTVVRRPYLQAMTASSVIVVWATREPGVPEVRLSGGASRTVTGTSRLVPASRSGLGYDYYHHEVAIGGLAATTTYSYDATVDEAPVASASFRTAPPQGSGTVSFVVFGDSGTGSAEQRTIAQLLAGDSFDLALHAGDIVYGTSTGTGDAGYARYNDWFFGIYSAWLPSRPFFPAEGNHDSRPSNGNGVAYLDTFTLPTNGASAAYPDHAERYYSFDYGPVHFVVLDTEFAFQDTVRRTEQISWLESDLAATTQPWKIALFHRSPYSAGGEHGSDLAVRNAFGPVFDQYGVQLALSAHEHDYERTRPQGPAGVVYVVTGGGGAPLYPSAVAEWTAYSATRHHYVRVAVTACELALDAIGTDGTPFDGTILSRCSTPPPPAAPDVILHAADALSRSGGWTVEPDATAADGRRMRHPDAGAAKLSNALAQPTHFFDLTFDAVAGVPYRLWIRSKADRNYWGNDSVFVQFEGSVDAARAARYRIGTTDSTTVNLEECSGCGLSGWGWEDTGWGRGVLGPVVYFAESGPQRMRIQTREDGLSIDQIVLSPERYLSSSPGATKNDTTILTVH